MVAVADSVQLQSRTFEADCRAAQSGMQANPMSGIVGSLTWLFLSCRSRTTIAVGPCLGYPDSQVWTWCTSCRRQHSKRDRTVKAHAEGRTQNGHIHE